MSRPDPRPRRLIMLDAQNPTVELHGAVYWAENDELILAEKTAAWRECVRPMQRMPLRFGRDRGGSGVPRAVPVARHVSGVVGAGSAAARRPCGGRGGGWGGLHGAVTAYYLAVADPSLRVAVLEREVAGFGASGRNGGWCSAIFPASLRKVAASSSRDAAVRMQHAMNATVAEVARVVEEERIDCRLARGGYLSVARNRAQLARARAEVDGWRSWGFGEDHMRLLDAAQVADMVTMDEAVGGTLTPHCAALDPARLVRGLAAAVAARGVEIHEQTPVTAIDRSRVSTPHGTVRAEVVVQATEGYTPDLPGHHRDVVPMYSLMVATEALPEAFWVATGLVGRTTFSDKRHLRIYGQRTADGRIAFGGRGAPYHFIANPAGVRPRPPGAPHAPADSCGPVPRAGRCPVHPHLGWEPRHPTGLVPVTRLRPAQRPSVRGRVRRGRGRDREPGWPHAGRPDHRRGRRPARPALAGEALTPVGAGAAAVARRERRHSSFRSSRPHRSAHGPTQPPCPGILAAAGPLNASAQRSDGIFAPCAARDPCRGRTAAAVRVEGRPWRSRALTEVGVRRRS
jgi:glycine/D-amino acid oxidase-like deaminating enzyme